MRPLALFTALVALALRASEVVVVAQQQQPARISVTGPLTGYDAQTGAAPARMNINDMWARGGPSWDLYVLALAELQAVDEADELSYFKIMGDKGPTYRAAADSLRVAYWDWAVDSSIPVVMTLENLEVNGPSGPLTIRNPFHSYHFQNYPFTIQYMNGGTLSKQNRSTRCPTQDLIDDVARVNAGLASSGLKGSVYNTFTTVTTFENMETDRYTSTSFESPHNNVHNAVGCANGTMYDLNWSAFDPAFMLHHTQVDRLIALWQAVYPAASIFTVVDYAAALYGTPAGNVTADTPLKPFHDSGAAGGVDGFHTSRSVRDIAVLGYTYPELQVPGASGNGSDNSSGGLSPDELAEHVRFQVNSLYSNLPTTGNASAPRLRHRSGGGSSGGGTHLSGRFTGRDKNPLRRPVATRKTWSVAIAVDRAEVPLPATIGCYILAGGGGDGGDDGTRVQVGRMSLLAIPAVGVTHSNIPLDGPLGAVGGVDLADADEVAEYLNQTLRFEVLKTKNHMKRNLEQARVHTDHILKGDGTPIENLDSIPSLQVAVQDRDYTPRESDADFPTYGAAYNRKWGRRHGRWAMLD
ncbi:hypothetical protein Daus18300_004633 [Diaporthe australafricana]|uniref:tyrosinase n=1 Tax=Diaporthe australafricana TaxID=127596 RepID=A0ABR3X7L0_9PEZI